MGLHGGKSAVQAIGEGGKPTLIAVGVPYPLTARTRVRIPDGALLKRTPWAQEAHTDGVRITEIRAKRGFASGSNS